MVKNPPANVRDSKRCGFNPWVGKTPEEGMATHSSILLGQSHGQRSLVVYSPQGHSDLANMYSNINALS